jgi:hypothetical protein
MGTVWTQPLSIAFQQVVIRHEKNFQRVQGTNVMMLLFVSRNAIFPSSTLSNKIARIHAGQNNFMRCEQVNLYSALVRWTLMKFFS